MVGIFLLMITEYFLLDHPKRIHQLYMALFVPVCGSYELELLD
jgi:hypothetical protein